MPKLHQFGEGANGGGFVRMSSEALVGTHIKNMQEKWRYLNNLKRIITNEKVSKHHAQKQLDLLYDEYKKMLADGFVLRKYRFPKYDTADNDQEDICSELDKQRIHSFLPVVQSRSVSEIRNRTNSEYSTQSKKAEVTYQSKQRAQSEKVHQKVHRAQSEISLDSSSGSMMYLTELPKSHYAGYGKDFNDVFEEIPEEFPFVEEDEIENEIGNKLTESMSQLAVNLHALAMWKHSVKKIQEEEKSSSRKKTERKRRFRKQTLYPGDCKTTYAFKKFLDKEAEERLVVLSKPRRDIAKIQRQVDRVKFPVVINREKTTSAIFRDFQAYKDSLEFRRQHEVCD